MRSRWAWKTQGNQSMTRIAFFSDDEAGTICARLVCLGLAALPVSVTLALPAVVEPQVAPPAGTSVVTLGPDANAFDVERALRPTVRSGDDFVAALPLGLVRDRGVRDQFDAVIAVGDNEASAARALSAARYLASNGTASEYRPTWFLVGPGQSVLRTKARLSASAGPALPFAVRSLPMGLPPLTTADRRDLARWHPEPAVRGTGLLLAALASCIAADPTARGFGAADLAALMEARTLPAERALSDRLVALANAYGAFERAADEMRRPARADFGSARRAADVRTSARPARRRADGQAKACLPNRV